MHPFLKLHRLKASPLGLEIGCMFEVASHAVGTQVVLIQKQVELHQVTSAVARSINLNLLKNCN